MEMSPNELREPRKLLNESERVLFDELMHEVHRTACWFGIAERELIRSGVLDDKRVKATWAAASEAASTLGIVADCFHYGMSLDHEIALRLLKDGEDNLWNDKEFRIWLKSRRG